MVVGSGEEEAVELRSGDSEKVMAKKDGCGSVMRWERFLPRMVLRVLLVEADDSTRQIIAALLRKCNYKVVAVPDGLKAWEVLKGRPQNIDIILTEVELPSISGYALLTLIMEHEICKNIPVIMMSSNDSISTVYKCMLRGAADFLVKPIRKNELKNMWQHVWRRRSSTIDKNGPNNESVEEKVEATAENATSDHLSGYKACGQGNKECNEKGSDAQSSCTKPDMEAESSYMANMQDLSQPNWSRSLASDMKLQMQGQDVKSGQELLTQKIEACGLAVSTPRVDNTSSWNNSWELERQRESHNNSSEACENNDLLLNSSRKAIDLIGSFDNYKKFSCRSSSSNNDRNKFEFLPRLDLSLRRPHNDGSENQTDEKHTLNHSNASAFSRYVNTTLQPLCLAPVNVCSQKYQTGSDQQHSLTHAAGYNSEPSGSTLNAQKSIITMATGQFGQTEIVLPSPQDRAFPVAAPVPSINFDGLSSGLGSVQPAIFNDQSGPSSIQSPSSATHQDGAILVNQHQPRDETIDSEHPFEPVQISNNLSQTIPKEDDKVEPLDDQANFSSVTGQSASSRFCNGTASHLNSIACGSICGSNETINLASICKTNAEGCTEEGLSLQNENCYRTQREAALMKFRLKRKDRCFEKKVRYESRKKLAEQRPRVKGQFVRQLNTEPTPQEMGDCSGNSLDG